MTAYSTTAARWQATSTRDPEAATASVYAVRTTRIYCRSNCRSRLARRSNIIFFDTSADAVKAGYRACKRCQPQQVQFEPERELVESICTRLGCHGGKLTLADMAAEAGLSRWHFWRIFKKVKGVTPREWSQHLSEKAINIQKNDPKSDLLPGVDHDALRHVQYTTVQTTSGVLLVAFEKYQITKLDLVTTESEALFALEVAYPYPEYATSILVEAGHGHELLEIAGQIAEALEKPSGKTLSLCMSDALFDHMRATDTSAVILPSGEVS